MILSNILGLCVSVASLAAAYPQSIADLIASAYNSDPLAESTACGYLFDQVNDGCMTHHFIFKS